MPEKKKDEEIIEEADTALTSEDEETQDEPTEEPVTELETTDEEVEEAPEEELEEAFEEFAEETETKEEEPEVDEDPVEEVEVEKTEEVDVDEEVEAEEEEVIELETEPSEELEIPAIPIESEIEEEEPEEELAIPDDEAIKAEVIDDEEILDAKPRKRRKKKQNWPQFWIGLSIGLVIAVAAEVLFTIPYWNTGSSSPALYYAEIVVILIAFMIPGLISRSIQKGILGGFMIFVIAFGLPFLMYYAFDYIILNPLTPLLSSTEFAIDAYAYFQDMFNLTLIVDPWMKWVIGIIDVLAMFVLTVIVVTLTTWLLKTVTLQKKKVGHWIGIPFLSIGIIVFTIFMPLALSSTYGVIHASTSFLAGSSYFVDGMTTFEGSGGSLQSLQTNQSLEDGLIQASEWFDISFVHYDGLRNIGVINFAALVAGQYRPLIEAGDQLALSALTFTQVLYPLFLGIAAITDSLNNATSSLVNFGTSPSSTAYGDKAIGTQAVNQTKLDELKTSISATVTSMENAEAALSIVKAKLEAADVEGAFIETEATLAGITTDGLPVLVGDIINDIRAQLSEFRGHLTGFTDFINFTSNALNPTKEILWTTYYSLVGNEYLRNYDFATAYEAYENATEHVALIDLDGYNPPSTLGDVFSVQITEGFSTMLEDLFALMDPLLNEQKYFAETYLEIDSNIDLLVANGFDITSVDYGVTTIGVANSSADIALAYGNAAQIQAGFFEEKLANNTYGSFFNTTGGNFYKTLTDDFKPQDFAEKTYSLVQAIDYTFRSFEQYALGNNNTAITLIGQANAIIQTEIITALLPDTPAYFSEYLIHWSTTMANVEIAMLSNNEPSDLSAGVAAIIPILTNLDTETAIKV